MLDKIKHICTELDKQIKSQTMNRIQEHILQAAANHKDKRVSSQIQKAVVPAICSRQTWYHYLSNTRQPSLITAAKILEVLQVWTPELQLEDLLTPDKSFSAGINTKLVNT